MSFFFNFMAALTSYTGAPEWLERWIEAGCVAHTPQTHKWWDEPMF